MSSFIYPQVALNRFDFLYSLEHKEIFNNVLFAFFQAVTVNEVWSFQAW